MGSFRNMASNMRIEVKVRLKCGSGVKDVLGSETWGSEVWVLKEWGWR